MEAIRLHDIITENGLLLNNPKLKKYLNKKVEITILPIEEEEDNDIDFWDLPGSFDQDDIEAFETSLARCRKIEVNNGENSGKLFD